MRVLSANLSGLNAAVKSGFFELQKVALADVLCLQETRCQDAGRIGEALGYNSIAATRGTDPRTGKAAHGGVAIFSRLPISASPSLTHDALALRGQFVAGTICGVVIASVYVTLDARPEQFAAFEYLFALVSQREAPALVCGDMKTFRDDRDAWSFSDALERGSDGCDRGAMSWFADVFRAGWIDAIEIDWPTRPLYTWWQRPDLFERGSGTRVDYILASRTAHERVARGSAEVITDHLRGGHAQIALTVENAV